MAVPAWKLEADNKTVTAMFANDPTLTAKFTTAEIDRILKELGEIRAEMEPLVPDTFEMAEDEEPVIDPIWETSTDQSNKAVLLHLCDPRFGWLHYALPREEAKKLGGFLQE